MPRLRPNHARTLLGFIMAAVLCHWAVANSLAVTRVDKDFDAFSQSAKEAARRKGRKEATTEFDREVVFISVSMVHDELRILIVQIREYTHIKAVEGMPQSRPEWLTNDKNKWNFAVVGQSGAGKSSMINVMRGVSDDHGDAAPTGTSRTTSEPTKYTIPDHPDVYFWDIPGHSTDGLSTEEYAKKMGLRHMHHVTIVSAGRILHRDVHLAQHLKENNVPFCWIHNKVQQSMDADKRKNCCASRRFQWFSLEGKACEDYILSTLRSKQLAEINVNKTVLDESRFFLVDAWHSDKFDYLKYRHSIIMDLMSYSKPLQISP